MTLKKLRSLIRRVKQNHVHRDVSPRYQRNADRPSFFDLPGEIRNRIYEICVKDFARPDTLFWCNRVVLPLPALTCVSRGLRQGYLSSFDGQHVEYSKLSHLMFGHINLDAKLLEQYLQSLTDGGVSFQPKATCTEIGNLTTAFDGYWRQENQESVTPENRAEFSQGRDQTEATFSSTALSRDSTWPCYFRSSCYATMRWGVWIAWYWL